MKIIIMIVLGALVYYYWPSLSNGNFSPLGALVNQTCRSISGLVGSYASVILICLVVYFCYRGVTK